MEGQVEIAPGAVDPREEAPHSGQGGRSPEGCLEEVPLH